MKLFDIVGGVAVAAWLVLTGLYVYRAEFQDVTKTSQLESSLVMKEGETWLTLRRENEDVGFAHQTRTRLQDGWLLEYDMVMAISLIGSDRAIETNVKATLDEDGYLQKFNADVTAGENTFSAQGRVEETTLTLNVDLGLNPSQRTVDLEEPPRLSSSAFNQLLATDALEPGESFEESFFDPTSMKMTSMTLEYVGETEVDIFDETMKAHHIKQRVSGNELDVYVDEEGQILIQEFPLRMIGMRVPAELGKTRASALRRKLDAMKDDEKRGKRSSLDLSVDTALDLIGGTSDSSAVEEAIAGQPSTFTLKNHNSEMELDLTSPHQEVAENDRGELVIRTTLDSADAASGDVDSNYLESLTQSGPRVDADSDAIAELVSSASSNKPRDLANEVTKRLEVAGEAGLSAASSALEHGKGDCTEHALVMVAALRHVEIPARFASGVLYEDDKMTPHQWVQYFDGERWREIDVTRKNLSVGPRHIQLFTHAEPEHSGYVHALDQLEITPVIEPMADDAAKQPDAGGDGESTGTEPSEPTEQPDGAEGQK